MYILGGKHVDFSKMGKTIKEIRIDKEMSIKDLAELVGVSSSLLSQIERGLANPSLNTLRSISQNLDVPMFSLFLDEDNNHPMVVRKADRIRITASEESTSDLELGYDLLSPDLKGAIQLCEMDLGPHQFSSDTLSNHDGEEVAVCIKGTIELHLERQVLTLNEGDSVRIEKSTPHRWRNPSYGESCIIFAITPPIF